MRKESRGNVRKPKEHRESVAAEALTAVESFKGSYPHPRSGKSELMSRVGTKNTSLEIQVRKLLARGAVRYRLHRRDLPGRPDIYIPRLRLAIFVNGCFWHGHNCSRGRRPKSNAEFWDDKIAKNIERDARVDRDLAARDIESYTVWGCEVAGFESVANAIAIRYEEAK